jgi:2-isopropylmalate synthase
MMNYKRYQRVPVMNYPEREWPNKEIQKAPIWCSVDLRDGNQALVEPMVVEEKIEMFNMLVQMGFKEIEIGFPAASQIEFDFLRQLVERRLIPDDVTVQVLTQCRDHLLKRTFESIQGIRRQLYIFTTLHPPYSVMLYSIWTERRSSRSRSMASIW